MAEKKSKIKIVFLEQTSLLGGAQINECYLQKHLDRSQFEAVVLCPDEGPLTEELKKIEAPFDLLPMPKLCSTSTSVRSFKFFNPLAVLLDLILFIPVIWNLTRYLRSRKVSLVVTNGMWAHFYGGISSKLAGCVCVWRLEDIIRPDLCLGLVKLVFQAFASVIPARIIVPSQSVKREMFFDFKHDSKISVIYNTVDLEKFVPDKAQITLRKEFAILEDAVVVGILSRLTPWKGHRQFLFAAKKILESRPKTLFIIVGGAIFESERYCLELKDLVKKWNFEKSILFAGFRRDMAECIASLDVCVLPSILPDPCPLVIFEGMAMKKPIVASNLGGVPEILADNETGVLVAPGDVEGLAEAVLRLIDSPQLAQKMGAAGRARVERKFSMENFIKSHSAVFNEAVSQTHAARFPQRDR